MAADLDVLILFRNARLRAWRAYGVPVVGGWRLEQGAWRLSLGCDVCKYGDERPLKKQPEYGERILLVAITQGFPCSHLAPLLGDDPPEVVDITALELLAGDPPR